MDFKLFSHPEMLLKDHLEQVSHTGLSRFQENGIFTQHTELLKVILAFHDIGKGSDYFQAYLLDQAPRSNLSKHSEFSAIWALHYCLYELKLDPLECIFAYVCIAAHHGNLDNLSELLYSDLSSEELLQISERTNYEELNVIVESLNLKPFLSIKGFQEILEILSRNSLSSMYRRSKSCITAQHWMLLNYLFSLLIWADKYSAIFHKPAHEQEHQCWRTDYIDVYKNSLPAGQGVISSIRNQAYDLLSQNIKPCINNYTVNMPTGSGKTINCLKVAIELRKTHPHLQRIIYSLPFTSVIDQNFKVFADILEQSSISLSSDLILAHHHLAEYDYKSNFEFNKNESEYLVETWDSELVVTTFVQLLASSLSVKNGSLKRFHRLANAVIILDEVQNIPHHYWPLLNHLLRLITQNLNSVVLLVTATMPMIYDPYDSGVIELAHLKTEWFTSLNRIEIYRNQLNQTIELDALADLIIDDYKENTALKRLIILNTIQSSLNLFNILSNRLPDVRCLYLSSNVIPIQRLERIDEIKSKKEQGMIIVSTQVVEAGVDIDVDIVYRDLAPLDSIIQAAGRCNRNESKSRSKVILFQLANNQKPYWKLIYDQTLVHATLRALGSDNAPILESELYAISKQYYEYLKSVSSQDISRRIISNLASMNLGTALAYHPKNNPEAFNLIESHPAQTVFVEYDPDSSELLRLYRSLKGEHTQDSFKFRTEMRIVIRKMGAYMISVDKKIVQTSEVLFIVEHEMLNQFYDFQTGFKRKPEQADYIY